MVGWEEDKKEKNAMKKKVTEAFIIHEKSFLIQKTLVDDNIIFNIFDTSHSLFPEGDYQPMENVDKFKLLGVYSFKENEDEKFKRFLQSLIRKNIVPNNHVGINNKQLSKFFVLGKTEDPEEETIKNPYHYEFLKLHVSSSSSISRTKMEEFISELKDEDFHKSDNKVYINNWVHVFLSVDEPYNFDGLKINEVEYDTSVFLSFDPYDNSIKSNWYAIQAGLMSARH